MPGRLLRNALALLLLVRLSGAGERSPFDMVRYRDGAPQVLVAGRWYELLELDGIPLERVLEGCRAVDARRPEKRFCEDLVAVLDACGAAPGVTVTLTLCDVESGEVVTKRDVAMTGEKRNRIRDARPWQQAERIAREHSAKPDARFEYLVVRHHGDARGQRLTTAQACEDLDQLEALLENRFSYRDRLGVDYRAALDTIRLRLGGSIHRDDFHIQLRKLVALFGDGHSRVRGVHRALPSGFLPFGLADAGGRLAAFARPGRLLDDDYPFVAAIDGTPIERWLAAVGRLEAQGSPQLVRRGAILYLHWIRFARRELGLEDAEPVEATLVSADGERTRSWTGRVGAGPVFVEWRPAERTGVKEGGIGYLALRDLGLRGPEVDALERDLRALLDTKGLVIDVRGNGGGRRDALLRLLPYFIEPGARPLVVNVAAYRLPPGTPRGLADGYLQDRFLYPVESERLSAAQKAAIRALPFEPRWRPDATHFSAWHYLAIERGEEPYYARPVVILVDEACFSATDVFLGAFARIGTVTIMGTPTGGGSGRADEHRLLHSGFAVKLSTMASFRHDGRLYDGEGIAPDVEAPRTVDDLLGRTDSALEAALARLR